MGLLYTKYKIFHFKDKVDSLPAENPAILPPIHIRIKPTNVCNHNCSYCAYRAEDLQLGQDMTIRDSIPEAKMREILEDLKEMQVKAVTFSGGGEPFCYPHFGMAIRTLIENKISFASLSNGSRLTGELSELFAHHATWLRVSIDGWDDESYSAYRRVKRGEFAKVMNNMAAFKRYGGKCYLGVSLIVDQKNAAHVYELTSRLHDIGVDSVKMSPCIIANEGSKNNEYHSTIFETVKEQIRRCKSELENSSFEIFDAYHTLDDTFTKDYTWCPYLQVLPIIGADCNVYSCQDKAYNLSCGLIGSIKDVRFKDFWFSEKSKFFRINPSRDCSHHCVSNAKNKILLEYLSADREHLDFV